MSLYLGELPIAVSGPSRNIGEIIQSTIPLSDAGLHLLDGALISGAGSYAKFVTYIAGLVSNYPDLFITETAWQQAVTDYGVCGKFVYDSINNTVRLPKITGFTEGTTDVTALGDLIEAGLPNITGSVETTHATRGMFWEEFNTSGAFTQSDQKGYWANDSVTQTNKSSKGLYFNAQNSNSIYGNSTTVQPQTIKVLYYIVIATSTKTNIEVDIDEVMTDLNGKADVDLSNVLSNIDYVVESKTPTAEDPTWYRVYKSGWVEQGGTNWGTSVANRTSITFPKEFADTNYCVSFGEYQGYQGTGSWPTGYINKTTTGFTHQGSGSGNNAVNSFDWTARGQGA